MPSTNKLYSRKSRKNSRKTSGYIAKFLYTFCGIFASFGVVTSLALAGVSTNASAVDNSSNSNTVSATLPGSVAIRLLDSTATTEISSLDFNLTPTASGTSATQSMVVDVATSNPTGYKLYMQSDYQIKDSQGTPTGNYTTNLTHTDPEVADNIPTYIPGSGSGSGTNTLYWNYINPLLNAGIEDPSSKVASTIPAHGSPDKLDQYFTTTNSRQTEVSFNVSVDTTIVSGTYENQLLFSAVGNPTTLNYSISFDTDGGTMVGEDITESAAAGTHSITIPNNSDYTPTKQGYSFTHWQIVIPQGSSVTASCNNTNICNPGDNIVIHSGIDSQGDFESTVGLKANYEASGITSISYMQEMTSDLCTNSTEGDSVTLTDTRDNNTYTVKKLKDGNCWMTQNLRLTGRAAAFTQADTNAPPEGFSMTTAAENTDAWCSSNTSLCEDKAQYLNSGDISYGVYYNWYTATAGSGTHNKISGNAKYSICPKGWRLPTGGEDGEYQVLANFYPVINNDNQIITGDPTFVLSGARRGASTMYLNEYGFYLTSTAYEDDDSYTFLLRINNNENQFTHKNRKYSGFSVRCLASSSIHGLTVDPNGGTWEGSTEKQTFTGESGSTKEISSPTKPANTAYTISYDDNSQGATFTSYPTSTTETFTGWSLSGSGSFENSTYTFGDGSATLTAQYSNNLRSFTLPNIVKPDYTCKWAEGSPSGTQYPGGTFRTISGNTTYYAVCTTANITTISTMQEMTTSVCSNSNLGDSNTLRDIRDNNTYTVRKLADNNCWMTQNLNLQGPITLTPDDSNVSSNWTLPQTTDTYENSDQGANEPYNAWCDVNGAEWCVNRPLNLYSGNNSYGVYYSWNAATAGSGVYTLESGEANASVCPKGWRLPTAGPNGEFQALYVTYGSDYDNMVNSTGPHFVLNGWRRGENTLNQNEWGLYWPSTARSLNNAYKFALIDSTVYPINPDNKQYGYAVRCLAQNPTYTLTINPNGGTYKGSTDVQSYTGTTGETRTVSNPTGPAYNITYDDNNQDATFTTTPATANRVFSSWSLSGSGSFAGGTYEYASGNGMLTAQYDAESNMFILPFIFKSGYSCQWAKGSPSGTLHTGGSGYTTVSGDTTFYAVCTNNTFNSISNMQEMTPTICANASTGDAATLTDTRDNKTYTIRKLADGNCWMTQNLRLTGRDAPFTQADSDVSSSGFSMSTSAEDTGTWCTVYDSACDDQVKYFNTGDDSYGVYYNWYTATAGSGTYSKASGNASDSICPKGWKIPTGGGTTGQWLTLYNYYNSSAPEMFASDGPSFIMSGRRLGNTRDQGSHGFYWSSTAYSNIDVIGGIRLELTNPETWVTYSKYNGFSVRCLAKGYDVNISNTNTTSSTDKLDIPYGGSKTVDVTPTSGYYLSNVTCPSGYTCSGYSTGTSATGTQTVTITNNNTDSGGTLSFTGTIATPTSCATAQPVEPGSAAGTMNMYTSGGVQYVKLYTSSDKSTSACYTKSSQGSATWANAASLCPSGTGLPNATGGSGEFGQLVSAYGSAGNLYTATGWSGTYWSSTAYDGTYAYRIYVNSSSASVSKRLKTASDNVVCIVR